MKTLYNENGDPKGIECDCGEYHLFDGYVYAHWPIELKFTCPECGKSCTIQNGEII